MKGMKITALSGHFAV